MGSAMAYVKLHIQEARTWDRQVFTGPREAFVVSYVPDKNEDLIYSEVTSADGVITSFNKIMAYQSGRTLVV